MLKKRSCLPKTELFVGEGQVRGLFSHENMSTPSMNMSPFLLPSTSLHWILEGEKKDVCFIEKLALLNGVE